MPYDIVQNSPQCPASKPWAVVTEDEEQLLGCHPTREQARAQRRAVLVSEDGRSAGGDDTFVRSFEPELEIQTRAQGGDGRTIAGIAVPYARAQRISPALVEQFARGAFNAQIRSAARIPFSRDHMPMGGTLIGRTVLLRDDAAGLYGEWRVSDTPAGNETLELVRDGALAQLSIGFREGQNRSLRDGTVERVSAELKEVAVVLEGAYGEAATVGSVRATQPDTSGVDRARQVLTGLPELPLVD